MQCPCQLYSETEFSEDSYSEEDYKSYELNCLCLKRLEREDQLNTRYTKPTERNREKPKVKGKFGLAYVVQTPKESSFKPLGWQVEFQDTPSQIDRNCQKMLKWVSCPPLGECNTNLEANFLWCPGECKELLKGTGTKTYEQDPLENCCLIEIPKMKCPAIETKPAACVCQLNYTKKEKRNKSQYQECVCDSKNKTRVDNRDCKCSQKQVDKLMLCRKCCKILPKCTCAQSSNSLCDCEKKQLKYKRHPSPKNFNRESEQEALNICKNCRKSYYSTMGEPREERICCTCGKAMENNFYVKDKYTCESYDDSLDYIPKREICSKKKCKHTKDGCSQIKARDFCKRESNPKTANKITHTERKKSEAETKAPPPDKKPQAEEKPPQIENKTPVSQNENTKPKIKKEFKEEPKPEVPVQDLIVFDEESKPDSEKEASVRDLIVFDEEPKPDSEKEVLVQDLINFDDEPKPLKPKKFSTKAHGDEPSLLDRIKMAHHKQTQEIHPELLL